MAITAALLWTASVGLIYPSLGVNAFPARILGQISGKQVIFYDDVHPPLLPIIAGRSFHYEKDAVRLSQHCYGNPVVFASDQETEDLERAFSEAKIQFDRSDSYKTLISLHKVLRPAERASIDWRQALSERMVEPLKSTIVLYQLSCRH